MQALRDAVILLGLMLVLSSVRISRVEPVSIDLVPAAHAAASRAVAEPGPASAGNTTRQDVETASADCRVQVLRIETRDERGVLAVTAEPRPEAGAPKACRIG